MVEKPFRIFVKASRIIRSIPLLVLSFPVFFAISTGSFAQGEVDDQPKIFFRNEKTWSGSLFSNGWGVNYRFAKRINAFSSYIIDADLAMIRHPKEIQSQSPYKGVWGRSYVFGKLNETFILRSGLGYQKEMFGKMDQGGISIRFFTGGGLSLAILKPIYYQKITEYNEYYFPTEYESSPFDPDYMQSVYDIYDKEPFWIGIKGTTVCPGVFIKAGLCFEYGSEDRTINALEGGIQLEGFMKKLPIMALENNKQLFVSLFAAYRFGKVVDARLRK